MLTLADSCQGMFYIFSKGMAKSFFELDKGDAQGKGKGYLFVQQENRYKYIFFVGGGESKNLFN